MHGTITGALPAATVASSILRRPFSRGTEGAWIDEVRRRNDATLYRCYEASGDSIAALQAFDRRERIVMAEFGASPSERTITIAEQARRP